MRKSSIGLVVLCCLVGLVLAWSVSAQTFGTGWTVQYFDNPNLAGAPVATAALPGGISFNIGPASPAAGVPADNWSARYSSIQAFNAATYEFTVASDDGVRVLIDNVVVLDRFIGRPFTTDKFLYTFPTAGTRSVIVEYFDGIENAVLTFQWIETTLIPTVIGTLTPTPILTLTPFPTPTSRACSTPLPLGAGAVVVLIPGVNIRSEPSPSAPQMYYFTERVRLTVEDGPRCAGGYNWWRVRGAGASGWVAEGTPARYFLIPVDTVAESARFCAEPLEIIIGTPIRILNNLRVRSAPNSTASVVTTVPAGSEITVLEGPRCGSEINWWRVSTPSGDGWIAEGYPSNYWIAPAVPSAPPEQIPGACVVSLSLQAGSRVAVTYKDGVPRSLRAAPTQTSAAVASLIANIALEVIEGPVCAESYNWWHVRVVGSDLTGWIAEGRPGDYWFTVIYY